MSISEKGALQPKTLRIKWKIERFLTDCRQNGDSYISPTFPIHHQNKVTMWYLKVYPKGKFETKGCLPLYLHFKGEKMSDEVTVDYQMSIVTEQCTVGPKSSRGQVFKGLTDHKGWDTWDRLRDQISMQTCSSADTLTIMCEITFNDQAVAGKPKVYDSLLKNIGKGFEDYEALLESDHFSDVTFNIQDKKMHLHKAILMCRNPVFKTMFEQKQGPQKRQKLMDVVEINNVAYKVMKEVFRFIYSGKVENIDQIAKDLLIAADKYAIPELKTLCEKNLYDNLTVDNAIECLKFTEEYDLIHLKTLVMEFIAAHSKKIVKKPEFTDLDKQVMHQIIQLMSERD